MQHRTPAPAASRVAAALLAVLALAPDPAVGAHALAAAVATMASLAVMLADAGAPAVLAGVPHAVGRELCLLAISLNDVSRVHTDGCQT